MDKCWRSAVQCLVACVALLSLTVVCSRLHFNLATATLLFVIVVVLLARTGSFVSSILASIVAALCLAYVAPPAFTFRVDNPLDDVAIVAFLITSLIIARLVSNVRKQAEDARSSVSYKVIEAEERERQRIARDLHEDIGQRLTMLALEIEQLKLDPPNAVDMPSRVDTLRKQNLEILTDVKTLAHELYSPRLECIGISGVMKSFCRDLGNQKRVEIDFKSDDLASRLPPDISLCLFRVLQEALHNAEKHSGVRQFDVRLNETSNEIHLLVSDRGVGFNLETTKTSQGLGLNRMQERLKLVNGSFSVNSQPKRGTTIHARIPLSLGSDSMRVAARQLS